MIQKKSSLIDHIYINNPTKVKYITNLTPPFGEHLLIIITMNHFKDPATVIYPMSGKAEYREQLKIKAIGATGFSRKLLQTTHPKKEVS